MLTNVEELKDLSGDELLELVTSFEMSELEGDDREEAVEAFFTALKTLADSNEVEVESLINAISKSIVDVAYGDEEEPADDAGDDEPDAGDEMPEDLPIEDEEDELDESTCKDCEDGKCGKCKKCKKALKESEDMEDEDGVDGDEPTKVDVAMETLSSLELSDEDKMELLAKLEAELPVDEDGDGQGELDLDLDENISLMLKSVASLNEGVAISDSDPLVKGVIDYFSKNVQKLKAFGASVKDTPILKDLYNFVVNKLIELEVIHDDAKDDMLEGDRAKDAKKFIKESKNVKGSGRSMAHVADRFM